VNRRGIFTTAGTNHNSSTEIRTRVVRSAAVTTWFYPLRERERERERGGRGRERKKEGGEEDLLKGENFK
jgi:hypothetical protein